MMIRIPVISAFVQNGGNKYFIKFAGAPTEQHTGTPDDAVARLKATAAVYQS